MSTYDVQAVSGKSRNRWDRVKFLDLMLAAVSFILLVLLQSRSFASDVESYQQLADVGTGALVTKTDNGYQSLLRLDTKVRLKVSGMLVNAKIEQQFINDSQAWIEATYVFPLPDKSAVNTMRIKIGERVIEGEIKERQQARKIFVAAKKAGQQTGLLEQQRPNLFTTRVANIGPGETISVQFSYLQTLTYSGNEFSLRLPLTLTPRYIPGQNQGVAANDDDGESVNSETVPLTLTGWSFPTDQVSDAHEITPPQVLSGMLPADSHYADIEIMLEPGFEVAEILSPYHDIQTQRQSTFYSVAPRQNPIIMNRDFVLSWRAVAQQAPVAALFTETKRGNLVDSTAPRPHSLLMVMPPQGVSGDVVPPRELYIIIDTSGSMAGASLAQAKQSVLMALARLRPQDRFNIIEFNSRHRNLFPVSEAANTANIQQARAWVQRLNADGGTEMRSALAAALNVPYQENYLRQVVFITDGSVGNERQLLTQIHQDLGPSRLYTVGIGSAPNEFFMRKAAEFGKGTFTMIGAAQEVQAKMLALFDKIEKPVMTNLVVDAEGANAEMFPQLIPDLYQGEPLIITARFDQLPDSLWVRGEYQGNTWQQQLQIKPQQDAPGVATLWAREKVQHLEDVATKQGQRDLFKEDILQLGLAYSIVTRFTSFVAVAKQVARPPGENMNAKAVPNLMPAGSQQTPPSVAMPQTALGIPGMLFTGLISLLLAAFIKILQYNCRFFEIVLACFKGVKS